MRIEDYAVIGDTHTLAVVGRDGSIDWLCLPRFDSPACFAALVGEPRHGRFVVAPRGTPTRIERRYREDSLVLETEVHLAEGVARVIDCMPLRGEYPDVVRVVEGISGSVDFHVELALRFDYGRTPPWIRSDEGRLRAIAGPNALVLATPVEVRHQDGDITADFTVRPGDRVPFVLTWHPSHVAPPKSPDASRAIADTDRFWREWCSRYARKNHYREAVVRSLVMLKALTYAPTGGIVAAGTTSLPEAIGGARNWDYRYCWLRDATFTLYALLQAGYREEASAWRDWLLRAVAGDPRELQILYGPASERWVDERTLDWLPGYEGSRPVRIGNAAASQRQLDVYGEVLDTFHQARRMKLPSDAAFWSLQRAICESLESCWKEPDEGLWEVRGGPRQFVHSKVMAWVALDRAIKAVEQYGMDGPVERWRRVRAEIHDDVCKHGYDATRGTFTQSYGSPLLDASLLLMPVVGFLPPDDPRVRGTVAAIERELVEDGFVKRYTTGDAPSVDGLRGREGAFLACSFWLVDAFALAGRHDDARALFERLLSVRNDVGLLSEEYDTKRKRLVGNFPQAFSHVALVNSARMLGGERSAVDERRET